MGSSTLVEQWVEYGIGMVVFFLRFFARYKVVGIGGFAYDDLFAFIAMILFTVDSVTVQLVKENGSFVGLNEQTANALSDTQISRYTIGSKSLFAAWISYVTLMWSMKATLLFFYSRLTLGTRQQKLVKAMGIACVVAYIAIILTLFLHCTPIQKNWQIKPYAGDHCTVTVINYVVVAVLNVLTDIGILAIPIPLIWTVKISLSRKLAIGLLLSSGLFVITATLLRCILSLQSVKNIDNSTQWGIRETFVAIIAIQVPAIKPLFNKSRWLGSSNGKNGSSGYGGKGFRRFGFASGSEHISQKQYSTVTSKPGNDLEAGTWKKAASDSDIDLKDLSRSGSQELIIGDGKEPGDANSQSTALEIKVTQMYVMNNDKSADDRSANTGPLEGENTMPFKTEQWGLNTEISAGNQQKAAKKKGKAAKLMGFPNKSENPSP